MWEREIQGLEHMGTIPSEGEEVWLRAKEALSFGFLDTDTTHMSQVQKVLFYSGEIGTGTIAAVLTPETVVARAGKELLGVGGALVKEGWEGTVGAFRWARTWFEGEEEGARLVSSIKRVSSNVANKPFISEEATARGWKPPYPDNLSLREITTAQEIKSYRVHAAPDRPIGQFLAREKEIIPYLDDPKALRLHLGLPDVPIYITEVNVPANAKLIVGRIGAQPAFDLMEESGFQYQLVSKIPESSFVNTRPIFQPNSDYDFDMGF